jgi:Kdo2-lipid IVA lauroyltransferase/acyltransferase
MRFLLAIMWCLHFLPLPILGRLGEFIGRISYWIIPERRHITLTNLRLCFPAMSERERTIIAKQHFQAYGRSILERGILWWGSLERISKLIRIEPSLPFGLLKNEPVIFLCPHFVSLDVAGTLGLHTPLCSIYTSQRNEQFDGILKSKRMRFGDQLFRREEGVKPVIRAMRQGYAFLMLPDMDFGIKNAEFVPFFGVPAATLTAPARIAATTHAKVIPIIVTMLPNYQGWQIKVHPAWENFPGDDIVAATRHMNAFIETQIRSTPAEYLWSHRRFKTRPTGEADLYK